MKRLLLDFSLRTKAAPRVAQGLINPLVDACRERGWDIQLITAGEVDGFKGAWRQMPDWSDLIIEEVWLPGAARRVDLVYTQREGLRLSARGPAHLLQLHEHHHLRYASWSSLRATARGAWQRHRACQMYDRADGISFSSEWTRKEFLRLEGREPPVSVVSHLAGWPDLRVPERVPMKGCVIVANASTDPRDDPDWALRGWAEARLPRPWRLIFFGGARSARSSVPGVEWLGRITDSDLVSLIAGARIYLHTGRAEGFGLGIIEALQLGTAVVARGGSAVDELLTPSAGVLVAPDEPLGAPLRALASRDADALAHHAWVAGSRFSWSQTARKVADAMAVLLGEEPAATLHDKPLPGGDEISRPDV